MPNPNKHAFFQKKLFWLVLLLGTHAALLAYTAVKMAPTDLEPPLLAAGVSHWELGRYELYRVNPPLVRMIAAAPVMIAGCKTDWSKFIDGPRTRPEYEIGSQFIELNGERSVFLMRLARWACIPISLIGGVFCFVWARRLYAAPWAGWIALFLWCFDPLILGNGSLITNDVAAAAFGVVAGYAFWRWLSRPGWGRSVWVGLALALAVLAKTTWLLLYGLWPLMALLWGVLYPAEKGTRLRRFFRRAFQLALIFAVSLWIINFFYGFDHSFDRWRSYSFVSKKFQKMDSAFPALGSMPVPVPRQFLIGLDTQISDFEREPSQFFRGEWREKGTWCFYLYGLWVKWPHATQLLLFLAAATAFLPRLRFRRNEAALAVPALAVLLLVSSQTAINTHFRYVIPFVGLAFVFIGRTALLVRQVRWGKWIVAPLLLLAALSVLRETPFYLAYYNELAGGPSGGSRHMIYSATDWGQDFLYLKKWLADHPGVHLDGLKYSGRFEPADLGLDVKEPPRGAHSKSRPENEPAGPLPGWYALSVNALYFDPDSYYDYGYFLKFKPAAVAGTSIYIYHLTEEDITQAGVPLPEPAE